MAKPMTSYKGAILGQQLMTDSQQQQRLTRHRCSKPKTEPAQAEPDQPMLLQSEKLEQAKREEAVKSQNKRQQERLNKNRDEFKGKYGLDPETQRDQWNQSQTVREDDPEMIRQTAIQIYIKQRLDKKEYNIDKMLMIQYRQDALQKEGCDVGMIDIKGKWQSRSASQNFVLPQKQENKFKSYFGENGLKKAQAKILQYEEGGYQKGYCGFNYIDANPERVKWQRGRARMIISQKRTLQFEKDLESYSQLKQEQEKCALKVKEHQDKTTRMITTIAKRVCTSLPKRRASPPGEVPASQNQDHRSRRSMQRLTTDTTPINITASDLVSQIQTVNTNLFSKNQMETKQLVQAKKAQARAQERLVQFKMDEYERPVQESDSDFIRETAIQIYMYKLQNHVSNDEFLSWNKEGCDVGSIDDDVWISNIVLSKVVERELEEQTSKKSSKLKRYFEDQGLERAGTKIQEYSGYWRRSRLQWQKQQAHTIVLQRRKKSHRQNQLQECNRLKEELKQQELEVRNLEEQRNLNEEQLQEFSVSSSDEE